MLHKVLLVYQDSDVAEDLRLGLREAQLGLVSAPGLSTALNKARLEKPSVILVDVSLPSILALELCHLLKADISTRHLPIVILASQATESERIRALEAGADDIVAQPFSFRQIILRVKNSLTGEPVELSPIEFKLMSRLMEKPDQVLVRDRLLDIVWGVSSTSVTRTIDTTISRLRHKLGPKAEWLQTVRGMGYRLREGFARPGVNRIARKPKLDQPPVPIERLRRRSGVAPARREKRSLQFAVAD
jgi:two-component system phosphate regulon response regulator PhoB